MVENQRNRYRFTYLDNAVFQSTKLKVDPFLYPWNLNPYTAAKVCLHRATKYLNIIKMGSFGESNTYPKNAASFLNPNHTHLYTL